MFKLSLNENYHFLSWEEVVFQTLKIEDGPAEFEALAKDSHIEQNNDLRDGAKGDILICSLNAGGLTGTELYVYDLAKELDAQGHNVTIASEYLKDTKRLHNVKYIQINDLKTNSYFNIIHLNQHSVAKTICELLPNIPKVYTIHSEVVRGEIPFLHNSIKKYIATRPKIVDLLNNQMKIPMEKIALVYNPIDEAIYNTKNTSTEDFVLFFEAVDSFSKPTINSLVEITRNENKRLVIIGKKQENYIEEILRNNIHVQYFNEDEALYVDMLKKCDYSACILVGRTALQAWMCGKKCLIFDVDQTGRIISKCLNAVSVEDASKFSSKNVVKQIKDLYFDLKILIKIPTKNRTREFLKIFQKYYSHVKDHINTHFLISLDLDDKDSLFLSNRLKEYNNVTTILGNSITKVHAINRDISEFSKVYPWDVLIVGSDDIVPQVEGFDNVIRNKIKEVNTTDIVLFFNDGFKKDQLNTIPILGKKYYERFNYVYCSDYYAHYCDNEFTRLSKKLNKSLYFDEVILKHEHPVNSKGYKPEDFVHKNNKRYENIDFNTYQRRKNKLSVIPRVVEVKYRKCFQYPGITEKQALYNHSNILKHKDNKNSIDIYVGFPWAALLDDLRNEIIFEEDALFFFNELIKNINHYKEIAYAFNKRLNIHTVCQHIEWFKLEKIWEKVGINHVYVSHYTNQIRNKSIQYHPWTLIAANTENRNEEDQLKILPTKEKKFFFSFVGSQIESHRSNIRTRLKNIISSKEIKKEIFFELSNKWFLEEIVYEEQLKGTNLGKSFYEKHNQDIKKYNEIISHSIFSLCPEGTGPNTLRLWESMSVGSIPVLFENELIPPTISDYSWEDLCVTIPHSETENFIDILQNIPIDRIELMRNNCINAYQRYRLLNCFEQFKEEPMQDSSLINKDKINKTKQIDLYTTYFFSDNVERQNEIDECLCRNIENECIDNIYLFLDQKTDASRVESILNNIKSKSNKVTLLKINKIPSYKDWIENIKPTNGIALFSNADIYFDETINLMQDYLVQSKSLLCITRHEDCEDTLKLCKNPQWSQDVWAIDALQANNIDFKKDLDVPTGKFRCDNKIAYVFTVNGWDLFNPCNSIRCYHKHSSNLRKYDELDTSIIGAIAFVHPCKSSEAPSDVEIEIMPVKTSNIKRYALNGWLESEINKRKNDIPTITVPYYGELDKYFYRHKKCTFYDLVKSWHEKGLVNISHSNEAEYFWWNGKNNILLFDRDLVINLNDGKKDPPRWENEIDYKYAFFANEYNLENQRNLRLSSYWPYMPSTLEEFRRLGRKSFDNRKYNSIFIGSIENETQEFFREKFKDWNTEIDLFCVTDRLNKQEPNKYSFEEYINEISQAKFGICFRGNGPKCYRDIEYLSMGVPLIITEGVETNYPDPLLEGVHYFYADKKEDIKKIIENTPQETWENMSLACWNWYTKNASIEGMFNYLKEEIGKLDLKAERHRVVRINCNKSEQNNSLAAKTLEIFEPNIKILFNDTDDEVSFREPTLVLSPDDVIINELPFIGKEEEYSWKISHAEIGEHARKISNSNLVKNKKFLSTFGYRFMNFNIVLFDKNNKEINKNLRMFNQATKKCLYLNKEEKAVLSSDFDWSRRCSMKYAAVTRSIIGPCKLSIPFIKANIIYKKFNKIHTFDISNYFNDYYTVFENIIPENQVYRICKLWEFEDCDIKSINGKLYIDKEIKSFNYSLDKKIDL